MLFKPDRDVFKNIVVDAVVVTEHVFAASFTAFLMKIMNKQLMKSYSK